MHSTVETIVVVSGFALAYLVFTLRATGRSQLDLYDLIMLSTVAVVPWVFVVFPGFAELTAGLAGVAFPFVLMFGLLFVVLFVFIHRLAAKIHRLERDNRLLIQEVSLLKTSQRSQ